MGLLSKTLNMDADKLAEVLFKKSDEKEGEYTDELAEGALAKILQMDADRVAKLKPDTKEIFNNGFKKAEKEIAEQWESDLRKQFGVDAESKLQGSALVTAIKAAIAEQGKKGMEPDKVKLTKEYLDLETSMQDALKKLKDEHATEIAKLDSTHKKERSWAGVEKRIREEFMSLNPVLPKDVARANAQIDMFLRQFNELEYQEDAEGGYIPMRDGKRVEDGHGYAVKLSDLVKGRAEAMFEFLEQPPAGNAGNQNGTGKTVSIKFKDEREYLEKYAAATTSEQKTQFYDAWTAQQKTN